VQYDGWWADNFKLADGASTLFTDDVEITPNGWTTNAWQIVPLSNSYPMYYLAEWRNSSGFDRGLAYPYTTIYNNDATTEWQVDRCPYTVPGMLLWLRNGAQDFDYTLYNSLYDPPSYGPKHALLVVDSHYWPLEWEGMGTSEAHLRLNSRCQPGNATFTVPSQGTKSFTVRLGDGLGGIAETKTFKSLPAVSQFHDSLGYYPGLRYRPANGGLYFWDAPASLVVPGTGVYTTKITNGDKTLATDLFGIDMGDTILGSGNPRDEGAGVQYGVNIAVLQKALNGSWGKIVVWNAKSLGSLEMKVNRAEVKAGQTLKFQIKVKNISPARQSFTFTNEIPANTTFQKGAYYVSSINSIRWTGVLAPNQTKTINFWVKVNMGTPVSTVITNTATLADDASGATASAISVVK
jgi:immune inhibitor A